MTERAIFTLFMRQTWVVSGVLLTMLGLGMVLSFPSVLLPGIMADDSIIKTDLENVSWLISILGPASLPGFLISASLMDLWGRKFTQALGVFIGIIGWLLIYFATDVLMLIFGRILGGISCGATFTLGAVIVGEYSSPEHRGMFLNLKTAATCLGSGFVHFTGHYFSWQTVSICGVVVYTIALGMIYTWPESPAWLATRYKFEQSKIVWLWLRGPDAKSVTEFNSMIEAQKQKLIEVRKTPSIKRRVLNFLRKFTEKDFLKPTLILFFASMLLEACGRHTFPAYVLAIMNDITGDESKSFYYVIAIDIFTTLSATSSSVLVRMMKRRILLFSTAGAALVILSGICIYLYLVSIDLISNDRAWLPVLMLMLYIVFTNLGCTIIPISLLGELYPVAHRSTGSVVSGSFIALWLMVGLKITPILLESVKVYGTFAIFGLAMGVSLIVLYFILPETKDRTLQEIQDYFKYGRFIDDNVCVYTELCDTEVMK